MSKNEYLESLAGKLTGLPESEIRKTIDYYDEIICDRIEDGMTEDEAVHAVGSIDEIAQSVMYEQSIPNLIKASMTGKTDGSGKKALWIVLLVLGSPIWISLALALFSVAIAAYTVIWVMTGVVYILAVSFALSSVTSVVAGLISFFLFSPATSLCVLAVGLVCASLALLSGLACPPVTKISLKLSKMAVHAVKSLFVK